MDNDLVWMFFIGGPILGISVYGYYYQKYRNTNARYRYEHTTDAQIRNMKHQDDFTRLRTGLRNSSIENRNDSTPTQRAKFVKIHTNGDGTPKQDKAPGKKGVTSGPGAP